MCSREEAADKHTGGAEGVLQPPGGAMSCSTTAHTAHLVTLGSKLKSGCHSQACSYQENGYAVWQQLPHGGRALDIQAQYHVCPACQSVLHLSRTRAEQRLPDRAMLRAARGPL